MKFSAVILAGGNSRRMGRDKSLIVYQGETLLERQIQTARQAGASEVLVAARQELAFLASGCRLIRDRFPGCGPLGGIEAGLKACGARFLLVLAVDMPHVTPRFVAWLLRECSPEAGVVPTLHGRVEPLAAIYPKTCGAAAERLLRKGRFAARTFVSVCASAGKLRKLPVPPQLEHHLANWNRPEEVEVEPSLLPQDPVHQLSSSYADPVQVLEQGKHDPPAAFKRDAEIAH